VLFCAIALNVNSWYKNYKQNRKFSSCSYPSQCRVWESVNALSCQRPVNMQPHQTILGQLATPQRQPAHSRYQPLQHRITTIQCAATPDHPGPACYAATTARSHAISAATTQDYNGTMCSHTRPSWASLLRCNDSPLIRDISRYNTGLQRYNVQPHQTILGQLATLQRQPAHTWYQPLQQRITTVQCAATPDHPGPACYAATTARSHVISATTTQDYNCTMCSHTRPS